MSRYVTFYMFNIDALFICVISTLNIFIINNIIHMTKNHYQVKKINKKNNRRDKKRARKCK